MGGRIFGIGDVETIEEVDDDRVRASYGEYLTIDPMLSLDAIGGDPRNNGTNAINRIPNPIADLVRQLATSDGSAPSETSILDELDLTSGEGVRDAMHRLVALDLLGPALGPEEELLGDARATDMWLARLPRKMLNPTTSPSTTCSKVAAKPATVRVGDANVASSSTLFSSSIGMTFVVAAGVDEIEL